jgi:Mg2+ and Co2+ transporter CorA
LGVEEARTGATSRDVLENPFAEEDAQHNFEQEFKDALASDDDDDGENPSATRYAARRVVKRLTKAYRIAVERQQLSIFLTKDGTIISIFSRDGAEIIPSIIARLRSKDTLLRQAEDPSMLLQALLDVTVDKSLEITDAFRRKLDDLEGAALLNPSVATVRHLHVLSQQLVQIRRGMTPLQKLVCRPVKR